tara:strand:- start:226 stop:663 length:438 start_codon:yes stop_codon:yes gene_type:complete
MSKIWDDLKSNMKDWSNAAVEKAEEVSKVAVAKTEELTKISKIKLVVHQLQRDKNKEISVLGKLVYNHSKEANMSNFTGNTEFFSHVEKIDSLNMQIIEKENEIKEIKTETMQEPQVSELPSEPISEAPSPDNGSKEEIDNTTSE